MTKGIDISEFQNNINYDKLKSDGIEFVIIRCGYGKNAYQKDALFEQHYANCRRVGLKVGAYLYSYANTIEGAEVEAKNCLGIIADKKFDLPIFYDVEDSNTTGKADKYTITKMCQIFCDRIIAAGYQAGVYASLYWFNDKMYIEELEKYNIWLAQWNEVKQANFRVDIWQYTSDGHIESIGGRVDMNECYKFFPINDDTQKKIYENGSTKEGVYSDIESKHYIGYLNPYEVCDCLGIYCDRAIVLYKVDGTNNYKIGFVEWLRGRKINGFLFWIVYRLYSWGIFNTFIIWEWF